MRIACSYHIQLISYSYSYEVTKQIFDSEQKYYESDYTLADAAAAAAAPELDAVDLLFAFLALTFLVLVIFSLIIASTSSLTPYSLRGANENSVLVWGSSIGHVHLIL